jgi:hypothetical protein
LIRHRDAEDKNYLCVSVPNSFWPFVEKFPGLPENSLEHLAGEAASLGILLAGMVRANEDPTIGQGIGGPMPKLGAW